MQGDSQQLKALIFGATGAIGSELVALLLASPKWSTVHCVGRRGLDEWQSLPGKEKLQIQRVDMDEYFKKENTHYGGYSAVFCCLGTQVKHGEETFIKIDKTYPLWAADIALKNNIPHYLLVSSMGSDPGSCLLYSRTKGQVEEELRRKGLNMLSIFKPGLLRNRKDARCMQKLVNCLCCCSCIGIEAIDAVRVLKLVAEKHSEQVKKSRGVVQVLENGDMLDIAEQ